MNHPETDTISTKVQRLSAGGAVQQRLREEIETEVFKVGSRLPSELSLAKRYGVSRPVVREALRSLATLGLTDTRTGSGTYVIAQAPGVSLRLGKYSEEDLREARPYIEVPAASFAADRRSDEDVFRMRGILNEMASEPDAQRLVDLDGELHLTIAKASENLVFTHVLTDIREAMVTQSELLALVLARQLDSHHEHTAIVAAIERGDSVAAAAAMTAHLEAVTNALVDLPGLRDCQ